MKIKLALSIFFLIVVVVSEAQTPTLIIQRGHLAPVSDAVVSSKHQLVITASYDKSIKFWHQHAGKEVRTLDNFMKGFSEIKLALTSDEQSLIATSANGSLKMIDLINGTQTEIKGEEDVFITEIAVRPKSSEVAIGYEDGDLAIWDYEQKKEVQRWKISEKNIVAIQFSPNGQCVFAQTFDHQLFVYDFKKQKKLNTFPAQVRAFDMSPNGKTVAFSQLDSTFLIAKTKNGKILQTRKLEGEYPYIGFIDNKAILLMKSNFQLSKIDTKTFKLSPISLQLPRFFHFQTLKNGSILYNEGPITKILPIDEVNNVKEYKGYVGDVYASSVSAVLFDTTDRNIITGGGEEMVQWWGEHNGKNLPVGFDIAKIKMDSDGLQLIVSGNSNDFYLINRNTKKITQTYKGHSKSVMDIGFVGEYVVSVSKDKTIKMWSKDGAIQYDWKDHQAYIYSLSTHKDLLVTGDSKGQIYLWNVKKGKKIKGKRHEGHVVQQLQFSSDGNTIYIGYDDGEVWAWDWQSDQITWQFQPYETAISVLAFKNNRLYVSSGLEDTDGKSSISIYNVASKKLEGVLEGHISGVNDLRLSQNGKWLLSAGNDYRVRLWSLADQQLLVTQYTLGDGSWAWVTPTGMFDASAGAMELMHYAHQNEPIQLSQLKERYYEPDLLQKILGYNEEPIREVEDFNNVALYPSAQIEILGTTLHVNLKERNGGIGKVSVFINGKEVIEDANPKRSTYLKVNLKGYSRYMLPNQANQIGVKVFNASGWMQSDMISLNYTSTSAVNNSNFKLKKKHEPTFYALIIGTSNYRGESLDLTYADKDAKDMANALSLVSLELFGADHSNVQLINTKQSEAEQPSKENIKNIFEALAQKVKSEDVFLIYLSGHGVSYGAPNSQFYYLTKEIASDDLGDEVIRNSFTISSQEFTQYLKKIPAQKQIMIIDACSSGSLVENLLSQSRSLSSSQKRALDRMKDRAGVFILAGSAANKVSYEASQFGQGLLTYSLLSGMRGGALRNNQYVDVMQLFQYAADKVPELAAVIGGVQRPVIAAPNSTNSFDLGQVTDSLRYKIPLEEVKPLFIKSNFQHEELYEDVLDLSEQLDESFINISDDSDASVIFINVKKYPNAYSVKGRYRQTPTGSIVLSAKLLKDKVVIGDLSTSGNTVAELISNLLDKVVVFLE